MLKNKIGMDSGAAPGGGNNNGKFYKFENVSNPDSIILSSRSGRSNGMGGNEGGLDNFDGILGKSMRSKGHQTLRDTLQRSKELSQKVKIHEKPNHRGGSIYLVEEFFNAKQLPLNKPLGGHRHARNESSVSNSNLSKMPNRLDQVASNLGLVKK
jgi:hypothetical protein